MKVAIWVIILAMLITAGLIAWQLRQIPETYYGTMVDLHLRGLK